MVVINIEMWPHGDENRKYPLAQGFIVNDATGNLQTGNYNVHLMKSPHIAENKGVWKSGKVINFPRLKLGPWDLLFRALQVCIGDRNSGLKEKLKITPTERYFETHPELAERLRRAEQTYRIFAEYLNLTQSRVVLHEVGGSNAEADLIATLSRTDK